MKYDMMNKGRRFKPFYFTSELNNLIRRDYEGDKVVIRALYEKYYRSIYDWRWIK